MFKEFKEFTMRGNVIDLAIGILIGGAFAPIAKSLVDDVFMPPIGLVLGKVDFKNLFVLLKEGAKDPGPYPSVDAAKAAGAVTLNYGLFLNTIVTFLIVAFIAFLIVRAVNAMHRKDEGVKPAEPATQSCPFCLTAIPIKATRCPACTSQLAEGKAA